MEKIIAIIFLLIVGFFCYATCKVASESDKLEEKEKENESNNKGTK